MPYIPNLLQNVIGRGLLADRPAALMAGRLYFATDESIVYRDNGTGWDAISLGEVTSVDGLTGDVDLSASYLGIDDAAATYLTQVDAATTYLTPGAADLAYDPLGIAETEVATHNASETAHATLFGLKADAEKPGPTISQGYEEDGANRAVAAADTTYAFLPSLAALDPLTPANDSWSLDTYVSADAAGLDIEIRATVTEFGTGTPYSATTTVTTTTVDTTGWDCNATFGAADFGLPYPYPQIDSVTWEWRLPNGEGGHLYSGARTISWIEPNVPVAYMDDVAAEVVAGVAAHNADSLAHPSILEAVDSKAPATVTGLPIEYDIYSSLVTRTNTSPDTSWADLFPQGPLTGGETPEGGWSVVVALSADTNGIPVDIRVTAYEAGTGVPYTAVKPYVETAGPDTSGEATFVTFAVADFDFGVTPTPPCDEIQIEWAVPGGETIELYSAWSRMVLPGAVETVVYTGMLAAGIADHEAALDPHPVYLTEAEADGIYVQQIEKGAALGVATLDAAGLIPADQLPGLALTTTFVAGSEALMLALPADTGDICVRTDLEETYVLDGTGDPTVLANWIHLISPTDAVASVDGRQGVVTLSDLYEPLGAAASAVSTHNGETTSVHGITDTADLIVEGDARLTDHRYPTAHAPSHGVAGVDAITIAPSQVTGTAVVDSDSRLTDARTPTAHASTHFTGGTDALTAANIGAASTTHASTHATGGSDAITPGSISALALSGWEAFTFGKADILQTDPSFGVTAQSLTSGIYRGVYFRPHKTKTIDTLTVSMTTSWSGLTLSRLGIYTVATSGTPDVTLVARTGANFLGASGTAPTLVSGALDTTGGYPATYELQAGQLYCIMIIAIGTTPGATGAVSGGDNNWARSLADGSERPSTFVSLAGQTDLPTGTTSAAARVNNQNRPWVRLS